MGIEHYYARREEILAKAKERYASDPEFRERKKAYHRNRYDRQAKLTYDLRRKYGLSPEEVEAMKANGCHICGSGDRLHVDHDHACCDSQVTCGKCVRGVLCSKCNVALGNMQDDPEVLRKAAGYLDAWREVSR